MGFLVQPFYCDRLFPRQLNLRLHTIRRHMERKVKRVDTFAEFKGAANQWLYIDLAGTH